ncbi:hypothetical protein ACVBEQ_02005 [Nakamurella sp. GG22]
MAGDRDPLEIAGRVWPTFIARRVVLAGFSTQPFDEAQWRDALVIVERGTVEVETVSGLRRAFSVGDILWLTGLNLRALHNPSVEDAVLAAVSRPSAR